MNIESIGNIKKLFDTTSFENIPNVLEIYRKDGRIGVTRLISAFEKKYDDYLSELQRIKEISFFENKYYEEGFKIIAGTDEVGRGPLAGPVVASIVILERDCKILGINDSKKLSKLKREQIFSEICEKALDYSIGVVSPKEIDEINILQATYKAMQIAINGLKLKPDFILVDAVTIPNIDIKQIGIIQGDAKSISIGASSIIAKVTRDEMMSEMDNLYPEYGFASNKGYGSAEHIKAIKEFGICPIHRRTFVKNFV